jgi:hypothetical protein
MQRSSSQQQHSVRNTFMSFVDVRSVYKIDKVNVAGFPASTEPPYPVHAVDFSCMSETTMRAVHETGNGWVGFGPAVSAAAAAHFHGFDTEVDDGAVLRDDGSVDVKVELKSYLRLMLNAQHTNLHHLIAFQTVLRKAGVDDEETLLNFSGAGIAFAGASIGGTNSCAWGVDPLSGLKMRGAGIGRNGKRKMPCVERGYGYGVVEPFTTGGVAYRVGAWLANATVAAWRKDVLWKESFVDGSKLDGCRNGGLRSTAIGLHAATETMMAGAGPTVDGNGEKMPCVDRGHLGGLKSTAMGWHAATGTMMAGAGPTADGNGEKMPCVDRGHLGGVKSNAMGLHAATGTMMAGAGPKVDGNGEKMPCVDRGKKSMALGWHSATGTMVAGGGLTTDGRREKVPPSILCKMQKLMHALRSGKRDIYMATVGCSHGKITITRDSFGSIQGAICNGKRITMYVRSLVANAAENDGSVELRDVTARNGGTFLIHVSR